MQQKVPSRKAEIRTASFYLLHIQERFRICLRRRSPVCDFFSFPVLVRSGLFRDSQIATSAEILKKETHLQDHEVMGRG